VYFACGGPAADSLEGFDQQCAIPGEGQPDRGSDAADTGTDDHCIKTRLVVAHQLIPSPSQVVVEPARLDAMNSA
jgi:hypothetical protein